MITLNSSLPSFSAQAYHKNTEITISSDSFSGWTILFFYPHDESPVCPTELRELARNYTHLQKLNCEVIGISVDTIDVH